MCCRRSVASEWRIRGSAAATGKASPVAARSRAGALPLSSRSAEAVLDCKLAGRRVDLVMLIMNKGGMDNLLSSKFKLGGRRKRRRRARWTPCRRRYRLEDASPGSHLLPFARTLCRARTFRSRHQAGQRQHTRFLWRIRCPSIIPDRERSSLRRLRTLS